MAWTMVSVPLRETKLYIDLNALQCNFHFLKSILSPRLKIMPIVKANAYGHGAVQIASCLEYTKDPSIFGFGVATAEEAHQLMDYGIKKPILILGMMGTPEIKDAILRGIQITVYSASFLKSVRALTRELGKSVSVHVKIETGMGRIGVRVEELSEMIKILAEDRYFSVCGVFSHLANAHDIGEKFFTVFQIATLKTVSQIITSLYKRNGVIFHLANSAGIIRYPSSHFDMVRPGLMLYGISPFHREGQQTSLKPVMSLKTRILYVKCVSPGTPIGYGGTWVAKRDSKIATIPIGYADGYNRHYSQKMLALVHGQYVKVIGTVCMDMCMLDVTQIEDVRQDDEVVLLGSQKGHEVTIHDLSAGLGTIPYEIMSMFTQRIPRIYIQGS